MSVSSYKARQEVLVVPRKNQEADPAENSPEAGMEEGRQRAEVEENQAPADAQATSESQEEVEERKAEDVFEVKVNPKLGKYMPESVDIDGKLFFSDLTRNRLEGTQFLNDVEYDEIKDVKESESGLQYIVKK
jgi:hypothetical protein